MARPSAEKSPRRQASMGTVGFRSADAALPATVSPDTNQNVLLWPLYTRGMASGPPTARPGKCVTPADRTPEKGLRAEDRALVVVEEDAGESVRARLGDDGDLAEAGGLGAVAGQIDLHFLEGLGVIGERPDRRSRRRHPSSTCRRWRTWTGCCGCRRTSSRRPAWKARGDGEIRPDARVVERQRPQLFRRPDIADPRRSRARSARCLGTSSDVSSPPTARTASIRRMSRVTRTMSAALKSPRPSAVMFSVYGPSRSCGTVYTPSLLVVVFVVTRRVQIRGDHPGSLITPPVESETVPVIVA